MDTLRTRFEAGQTIFREGDAPDHAYLLESGAVEITAERAGRPVVLSRLGPGDLLGEMAVIDESPRTATAVALESSVALVIDRGQINERLAQTDPIVRALLEGQLKRYRGALAAMQGKAGGSSTPVSPAPSEMAGIGKIRLESQLREALASRGLDLRLQPILAIADGHVAGYEALIRWTHPERGPVSPAEFIALAEETSLIVPVGEYVLDIACAAITALRQAQVAPLPFVAINVSARQLAEEGLIDRIVARADAAGFHPGQIKVEITESQALNYRQVAGVIQTCHGAGIRVALDDFGTGYSNLAHLHELPFDTVKVDQAFVRHMLQQPRAMAIVRAIVEMVHGLGADVVVEGVETAQELEILAGLNCRYAQGYLIGKPQPLDEILTALPRR